MPTLITNYNWGQATKNQDPELNRQLSDSYTKTAQAVNTKTSKHVTNGLGLPHIDPPASSDFNKNFELADIYVRSDTNKAWIMTSRTTSTAVTWTLIT
jgi:hypothetical protein